MLTQAEIDDMMMDARIRARTLFMDLMQDFTEPFMEAAMGKIWHDMPPIEKAIIKRTSPEGYKRAERRFGGGQ